MHPHPHHRTRVVLRYLILGYLITLLTGLLWYGNQQPTSSRPTPTSDTADIPECRLVSMPDAWNADLADLRNLPAWQSGDPNSWSPKMGRSIDTVMDQVAAENPAAVLVAGDQVEGHWGMDGQGTGLFGPTHTRQQRYTQIRRAGAFYYGAWLDRYTDRGLAVYPAVGDHEIGDNPWRSTRSKPGYGAGADFKRSAFRVYKDTWADAFTRLPYGGARYAERPVGTRYERTAYAVEPCPGVLVITLDVFARSGGDVHVRLTGGQLAWLDRVLADTTATTTIVQGHTPILGPVNQSHSSGLMYEDGRQSVLWQTLAKHQVDLYLAGEVHDITALHADGVTQVSHGGLIKFGELNYLTVDVAADGTVELQTHRFDAAADGRAGTFWCTDPAKRPWRHVVYRQGTYVTGSLAVAGNVVTGSGGELAVR